MEDIRDQLLNIHMAQQMQPQMQNQLLKRLYKLESTQQAQVKVLSELRKDIATLKHKNLPIMSQAVARTAPHLYIDQGEGSSQTKAEWPERSHQSRKRKENSSNSDKLYEVEVEEEEDDDDAPVSNRTRFVEDRRPSVPFPAATSHKHKGRRPLKRKEAIVSTQYNSGKESEPTNSIRKSKTAFYRGQKIAVLDKQRRDFAKLTPSEYLQTVQGITNVKPRMRVQHIIATLLNEKSFRTIDLNDQVVVHYYDHLKKLSKDIHSHLIKNLTQQKKISIKKAFHFKWSQLSNKMQDTYTVLLEKKAYKELGLDIGRCEDMRAARFMIRSTVSGRVNQRNPRLTEEHIEAHISACPDDSCGTSDMVNYPPNSNNVQTSFDENPVTPQLTSAQQLTTGVQQTEYALLTTALSSSTASSGSTSVVSRMDSSSITDFIVPRHLVPNYYSEYLANCYKEAPFKYLQEREPAAEKRVPAVVSASNGTENYVEF